MDRALRGRGLLGVGKAKRPREKEVEQTLREALVEGTGKVSKDQKKFKVLKSPGSWPTVTIKVPKKKK